MKYQQEVSERLGDEIDRLAQQVRNLKALRWLYDSNARSDDEREMLTWVIKELIGRPK